MSGGGIGSAVGTGLGVLLAPETGGMSLALPALMGGIGGFAGGSLTGSKNPLMDALMGGIGGGLTGGLAGGGMDAAGLFSDAGGIQGTSGLTGLAANEAADTAALGSTMGPVAEGSAATGLSGGMSIPAGALPSLSAGADAGTSTGGGSWLSSLLGGSSTPTTAVAGDAGAQMSQAPSILPSLTSGTSDTASGLGSYLGKQNIKDLAVAGSLGLGGLQAMMPHKQVNVGQNAANVMATNPSFNAVLPKYSMQNTATPYSGDWYKYGYQPQTAMYNAMPQPVAAAHGGLMKKYAHGGAVKGYAMGGAAMPPAMPQQNPLAALGAPQQPKPPVSVTPQTLMAAHQIGKAIGKHLAHSIGMKHTPDGPVKGKGGGQDDAIPARLSDGEFIVPADVVSSLGDGSTDEGSRKLTKLMHRVRADKATKGFPKKAKNPLSYLKGKA